MPPPVPDDVNDFDSFIRFARSLSNGLIEDSTAYPNVGSADFLESLAAWLEDARVNHQDIDTFDKWRFVAQLLFAGLMYE